MGSQLEFTIKVHNGLGNNIYQIKIDGDGAWTLHQTDSETCESDLETLLWKLNDILGKDLHG